MQRRQRQRQEQEKLVRQQQERRYPWTSTSLSAWRLSDVSNVTLPTSKPQLHQRQMDGWETQRMQNKASSKNQRQDTWNEQRYVRSDKWSEIGWSGGRAPDCRCCRPQTYHCCCSCKLNASSSPSSPSSPSPSWTSPLLQWKLQVKLMSTYVCMKCNMDNPVN